MLRETLVLMFDTLPALVLAQGQEYQKKGYVLNSRLSQGLLKARVKGESNQLYDVYIDLMAWPKKASRCSCQKLNCEHAVASLLALEAEKMSSPVFAQTNLEPPLEDFVPKPLAQVDEDEVIDAKDLTWVSTLKEQGAEYFSYQLGILHEGEVISILPLVIDLINRFKESQFESFPAEQCFYLKLGGGKTLSIEWSRLKPLLYFLLTLGRKVAASGLKLHRYQLSLLQESEEALKATALRFQSSELLAAQAQAWLKLRDVSEDVFLPKGLKASLRGYQIQGLAWLQHLRESRFGGILADDMGLGKTLQTLAHLLLEKEEGRLTKPALIVTPKSLVVNWYEEALRFTPDLRCRIFHGHLRHEDDFSHYDVIISTYGLIQRDKLRFKGFHFYYLILDEAQFIKNARTKTTQMIQQLKAEHRLCLSGTPMENHLGEIWSLFNFLMPGFLGDSRQFKRFFRQPIEKNFDKEKQDLLARRLSPFMLRRTKDQVLTELPAKTEITLKIELTGGQRDLYETLRLSMEERVKEAIAKAGFARSQMIVLDALLKLRQLCCDPRLLIWSEIRWAHGTSAKLKALLELLDNLLAENRRVLVFSQFTSMLALIEQALIDKDYAYLKLTGKTQDRQALVDTFQQGEIPIFLISLKAGGIGLNLTKADTVIHYDPWWNPTAEDQASDRSHRLGQTQPVFVYKLITQGTVEEAILSLQQRKKHLVEGLLSSKMDNKLSLLSLDELKELFKPLDEE